MSVFVFNYGYAADSTSNKHVVVFYRVPETVISCQRSDGDLVKGQKEFENMLKKNYSKRFIVERIQKAPDEDLSASQILELAGSGNIPILLKITLTGQHTISQTWQNAFGAQTTGYAPAIDMTVWEGTVDKDDISIYGYGPISLYWSPGTYSLLGEIFTSTDARVNTKNAIKWLVKSINSKQYLDPHINQYTNPEAYEIAKAMYLGDFKKATLLSKQLNNKDDSINP